MAVSLGVEVMHPQEDTVQLVNMLQMEATVPVVIQEWVPVLMIHPDLSRVVDNHYHQTDIPAGAHHSTVKTRKFPSAQVQGSVLALILVLLPAPEATDTVPIVDLEALAVVLDLVTTMALR